MYMYLFLHYIFYRILVHINLLPLFTLLTFVQFVVSIVMLFSGLFPFVKVSSLVRFPVVLLVYFVLFVWVCVCLSAIIALSLLVGCLIVCFLFVGVLVGCLMLGWLYVFCFYED